MLFLTITLGVLAYFQVGANVFGRWSLHTWKRRRRSLSSWILFPYSSYEDKVGNTNDNFVDDYAGKSVQAERNYRRWMAVLWPIKLAANAFILACLPIGLAIKNAFIAGIEAPEWFVHKYLPPKREPDALDSIDRDALAEAEAFETTEEKFKKLEAKEKAPRS